MVILNITLLISLSTSILQNEYHCCIIDLQENIDRNESLDLSSDLFHKTIDRYRQLISIVQKADAIFSVPVGIILVISFGSLCTGVYGEALGYELEELYYMLLLSMATIINLLPPLTQLHFTVGYSSICKAFVFCFKCFFVDTFTRPTLGPLVPMFWFLVTSPLEFKVILG